MRLLLAVVLAVAAFRASDDEMRVLYLRKENGRWQVKWQLTLSMMPGC